MSCHGALAMGDELAAILLAHREQLELWAAKHGCGVADARRITKSSVASDGRSTEYEVAANNWPDAPCTEIPVKPATAGDVRLPNAVDDHESFVGAEAATFFPDMDEESPVRPVIHPRRSSKSSMGFTGSLTQVRMFSHRHTEKDFVSAQRRAEFLSARTRLQKLVQSRTFEWGCSAMISLNALLMLFQTQIRAQHFVGTFAAGSAAEYEESMIFFIFQILFCLIFTAELMLRWAADGFVGFFFTSERSWNIFDLTIVTFSFFEMALPFAEASGTMFLLNPSTLRLARIVRIIRVVRVIRVMRFFRELRLMLYALMQCAKLLSWVILVLLLILFMFGMSFTTATSDLLEESGTWTDPQRSRLVEWFGTVDRSILNLFQAVYGGTDWGEYYNALRVLPGIYVILFLAYMCFALLAVVNVITAIFVDSAFQCNQNDTDILVNEELEAKKQFENRIRDVFEEMDDGGEGQISLQDFEARLDDERVIAYFNALTLEVRDARKLFKLLDYDQSGTIDVDEFLTGCMRLRGGSRAFDQAVMQMEIQWMAEALIASNRTGAGSSPR
mmetsp:Transcript_3285/g.9302  ORF Transcript_3285/g.9302 Transcript_3285/m.9302 type:complete len:559 (-) Transcript_3285:138-1814(-)